MEKLILYDYPGNVREVENMASSRLRSLGGLVTADDILPQMPKNRAPAVARWPTSSTTAEREALQMALRASVAVESEPPKRSTSPHHAVAQDDPAGHHVRISLGPAAANPSPPRRNEPAAVTRRPTSFPADSALILMPHPL